MYSVFHILAAFAANEIWKVTNNHVVNGMSKLALNNSLQGTEVSNLVAKIFLPLKQNKETT